ncbi:hypothetical protein M011DRAFT_473593 [Sporormia fimetaria CBS 119925]|uniref:Uncharacterized protein n=1 Tax=Sporormia fimetaria CBS 119925 TaxID=1340428 RepID=A0A6A6VKE9_9PLEO|nr:hypothetical protein M011DRAFT_473593 [Sporormia fimetaria CBS 119925]
MAISNSLVEDVGYGLLRTKGKGQNRAEVTVVSNQKGSFNRAAVLKAENPAGTTKFILKIPFHGLSGWSEEDAHMLRSEVELMIFLDTQTSVPVPTVLGYDTSQRNAIGAPYILMEYIGTGMPATFFWTGLNDLNESKEPLVDLHEKRVTFLKSLAGVLAQLGKIKFKGIGVPIFPAGDETFTDILSVGPSWCEEFFKEMAAMQLSDVYGKYGYKSTLPRGVEKISNIIMDTPAFTSPKEHPEDEQETFVLRHPDLVLQNIMVSPTGEVVGFIDWEGCTTVPRSVGYSTLPLFLQLDWIDYGFRCPPIQRWEIDGYRKIFVHAMREIGGPDTQYTAQSHIYQSFHAWLYDSRDVEALMRKVIHQLPGFSSGCDLDISSCGSAKPDE